MKRGNQSQQSDGDKQMVKTAVVAKQLTQGQWQRRIRATAIRFVHYFFPTPNTDCTNKSKETQNGECKNYYENGNLQYIYSYIDGKRNGEFKSYYENGRLEVICSYIDDKLHGEYKDYYWNGQLKGICSYTDDKINGEDKYYYSNGYLMTICSYIDGIKVDYNYK
jgi:hypothetical protein